MHTQFSVQDRDKKRAPRTFAAPKFAPSPQQAASGAARVFRPPNHEQCPAEWSIRPPRNNYVPSPNPVGCLFDRIRPLSALAAAAPAPRRFGKSPGAAGGWRPPPPGGGSPSADAARRSWRARSISHRLLAPFDPPPTAPGGGSRRPTTSVAAFGRRRAAGVVTRLVGPPWGLWGRVLCTFGGLLLTRWCLAPTQVYWQISPFEMQLLPFWSQVWTLAACIPALHNATRIFGKFRLFKWKYCGYFHWQCAKLGGLRICLFWCEASTEEILSSYWFSLSDLFPHRFLTRFPEILTLGLQIIIYLNSKELLTF